MKIIDTVNMEGTLYENGKHAKGVWLSDAFGLMMNSKNIALEDWRKHNEPYRSSDWQVILVTNGTCLASYNLLEAERSKGNVIIQKPGTLITQLSASPDVNLRTVSISPDLIPTITMKDDYALFSPSEQHLNNIQVYFKLIRNLTEIQPTNISMLVDIGSSLLRYVLQLHQETSLIENYSPSQNIPRQTATFRKFLSLLNIHGIKEHKIAFYADQMAMTPNYLNSLIKQVSGQTMMSWINEYLIAEAKAALSHSDMSVENISDALYFPNSAFFCKFFKKHTSLRPSQYRKSK